MKKKLIALILMMLVTISSVFAYKFKVNKGTLYIKGEDGDWYLLEEDDEIFEGDIIKLEADEDTGKAEVIFYTGTEKIRLSKAKIYKVDDLLKQ